MSVLTIDKPICCEVRLATRKLSHLINGRKEHYVKKTLIYPHVLYKMYDSEIFVFGTKIFEEESPDAISSLPLEISWKIFTYLDDAGLRNAGFTCKIWRRVILSNKSLRRRLSDFGLVLKLGSESLARFYKKNKKQLKKVSRKNYLTCGESKVEWTKKTMFKSKRPGDDLVIYAKRYKLF